MAPPRFLVGESEDGQRLDTSLASLAGQSRSQVRRWIDDGRVRWNDRDAPPKSAFGRRRLELRVPTLRLDFNRTLNHVGNSRFLGLGAAGVGVVATDRDINNEPGQREHEEANGPIDVQAPTLQITTPTDGSSFSQGESLPVEVLATDDVALAAGSVMVRFDVNGSGAIDATGETLFGTPTGTPNEFGVTFTNLAGPDGMRNIDARGTDTSSNVGQDIAPIVVPEPGTTLMLLFAVPLLGLFRRRRKLGSRDTSERRAATA